MSKKYNIGYIYRLSDEKNKISYIGWTNKIIRRMKEHTFRFYKSYDKEYNKFFYKSMRELKIDMLNNINFEI